MNRPARISAAALTATLVLLVAGCSDDDDDTAAQEPTPTPLVTAQASPSAEASPSASSTAEAEDGQTITIDLVDGKPAEKLDSTITVAKGDKITLVITSDKDYEVHVHAGDIPIKVTAGETVTKTITIDASPGSYEVEVEETGFKLFTLVVK